MTEKIFLRACRRERVERAPVWFMRQAGRYLPEYREIRRRHTLLDICKQPELAAEVTLQPLRRFCLDAAIVFADILLPLPEMGVAFEFAQGEGPVIHEPIRSRRQIDRLHFFEPAHNLKHVLQALTIVRSELATEVALLGFAGAPFTVASYMIEGKGSRHYSHSKALMYGDEEAWNALMALLTRITIAYLRAQVAAGADAVQLFDSWVGCLDEADYRRYVLPHSRALFRGLLDLNVPLIHFGTGVEHLLGAIYEAKPDVIGIDWRLPLSRARQLLGTEVALQGNLDPVALLAPRDVLLLKVDTVLNENVGPGFIFNLGHGVLPLTDPESLASVVDRVREHSQDS